MPAWLRRARAWPVVLVLAGAASEGQVAERCARRAAEASSSAAARQAPPAATLSALAQRRDLRSVAVADYLLAASGAPEGGQARERLQDRARSSTDPMLTVLALHMPCVTRGCRNIEAAQWSRLEPDNLLAWLALPDRSRADGHYLLQEVDTHVQAARSYRAEFDSVLAGLPPSGLSLREPWSLLNLNGLARACQSPKEALTAQRCDKVADMLWAEGGATERLTALLLGQQVLAWLPARRAVWEPRRLALETATRTPGQPWMFPLAVRWASYTELCDALVQPRRADGLLPEDWERARGVVGAAGFRLTDLHPRVRPGGAAPP